MQHPRLELTHSLYWYKTYITHHGQSKEHAIILVKYPNWLHQLYDPLLTYCLILYISALSSLLNWAQTMHAHSVSTHNKLLLLTFEMHSRQYFPLELQRKDFTYFNTN